MNKKPFNWGKWIEKYRFYIGGGLLFLILVGAGFQIYRENYGQESIGDRVKSQGERIKILEDKISKLQISSSNNQTVQAEQGEVAGVGTTQTADSVGILKQVQDDKITGKININTASSSQLDALPGIGAVYSQRIIDYRDANGGFKSIDEIKNVKGIGDKTFEKFKDRISI